MIQKKGITILALLLLLAGGGALGVYCAAPEQVWLLWAGVIAVCVAHFAALGMMLLRSKMVHSLMLQVMVMLFSVLVAGHIFRIFDWENGSEITLAGWVAVYTLYSILYYLKKAHSALDAMKMLWLATSFSCFLLEYSGLVPSPWVHTPGILVFWALYVVFLRTPDAPFTSTDHHFSI